MERNTYDFGFKMVNGAYSKKYTIDIDWTMEFFLVNIKQQIREDFPIDQMQTISIVEAGQYFNANGREPELAPELSNSDVTLREYFNKRIPTTAFYIRC